MRPLTAMMVLVVATLGSGCRPAVEVPAGATPVGRMPKIRPDYCGVTIPYNIAPLNFSLNEPQREFIVRISGQAGEPIVLRCRSPRVSIPLRAWRRLLSQNKGGTISFEVYARGDGGWRSFEPFVQHVAPEPIDPYVVYRRINVLYRYHRYMWINQRRLEDFAERAVIDNRDLDMGCVNCHTFWKNDSDRMLIQMRSGMKNYGAGMCLVLNGRVEKVDTRTPERPALPAFACWHPSGRAVAYSMDKVRQFFHSARQEVREGIDGVSDLAIYLVDQRKVITPPSISAPDRLETWPTWSPDGRYLYFCSAPMWWSADLDDVPPDWDKIRYDLVRVEVDLEDGRCGRPQVVLSARQVGGSISQPRLSPDGRFLAFCVCDHSMFPTFQPDADVWMMDLETGRYWRLQCNSDQAESWPTWSSNSCWLVFSSKRGDGLFLKICFAYIDRGGHAAKPFVLPQKDPAFYDRFTEVWQLPELVRSPVPLVREQMAGPIRTEPWLRTGPPVTGATPRGQAGGLH